jgi:hypothetical protein
MSQNPEFMKMVIKDVELHWPRLDQPYRFNQATSRTEACAAGAPNAGYSIAWDMSFADAKAMFEACKAHYDACRARDPQKPPFVQIFGMKKNEETKTARFTAKRRAMTSEGRENKPPAVIGPDHKPLPDPAIWSGSRGDIRISAFPATDPQTKNGGITLLLEVVLVRDARYGGDNYEDDFGAPETGNTDYSDFNQPAKATTPAPQTHQPPPPQAQVSADIAF